MSPGGFGLFQSSTGFPAFGRAVAVIEVGILEDAEDEGAAVVEVCAGAADGFDCRLAFPHGLPVRFSPCCMIRLPIREHLVQFLLPLLASTAGLNTIGRCYLCNSVAKPTRRPLRAIPTRLNG